jgi:RNA polymerase sigma factor (sigma-70 family)
MVLAAVDADALGSQLREIEPILQRFALRGVRNPDLARDLVQEALVACVAALPGFDGRSSLRTWMIGILVHKMMDHYRAQGAEPALGDDEVELLETASGADLERTVMARQQLDQVERALGALPDRERLAILMVDVEGVDRERVCHALGLTATHLRVVLHRGRNRLRRVLEHG